MRFVFVNQSWKHASGPSNVYYGQRAWVQGSGLFHICTYLGLAWLPPRLEMGVYSRLHRLGPWKMYRPVGIILVWGEEQLPECLFILFFFLAMMSLCPG